MVGTNGIVNVIKNGKNIGTGRILEADYFRKESERYIVRLAPASDDDFPKNIYASPDELTFIERPRY